MELSGYQIDQKTILPDKPGIYKYFNKEGILIYVGKAKNLKKRVASYFNKNKGHNRKTYRLVSEIKTFDFTVVNSEMEALLLENNLIKENQPKYNILLKDDKTFPYICILKERFPRIITTRKINKKKGEYFGPYSSVVAMNTVLDLLRKLYTIRTCKLNLSKNNIDQGKFKVCLEYHLGNCKGPCVDLQSEEDYNKDIESARKIIKGSLSEVRSTLTSAMEASATTMDFEGAQKFKDKIDLLDKFKSKSIVVNPKLGKINVLTLVDDQKHSYINYLGIENGAITKTQSYEVKKALDESIPDILRAVCIDILSEKVQHSAEILSNHEFSIGEQSSIVPVIGDKRKLVDLSLKNAFEYKKNKILKKPIHDKNILVLNQLKADLNLKVLPKHIECFDNSNIQGTNPVASMVCFKNGKASKKEYRHYNIKTVIGPDDFQSMYEVVKRRYSRLLEEGKSLPNLIVIDGGKGQLSKAKEALQDLNIYGQIPIIGIAKRLEEIYFPEDKYPVHISKKSISLRLLQNVRDEAHRFAITFHRLKRSNASINSELEAIRGIGRNTIERLLKEFKSVKKISEATSDQLKELIGASKQQLISNHFKQKKEQ